MKKQKKRTKSKLETLGWHGITPAEAQAVALRIYSWTMEVQQQMSAKEGAA